MLYELVHILVWSLAHLFFRFRVFGHGNIPAAGGVIVAANHASYLDPLLVAGAITSRSVRFMAKRELFSVPLFGAFIRAANALPVSRGPTGARTLPEFASRVRESGEALLVFPEGTRTHDGSIGPARRGTGALCMAAGVPVIPALITGTYRAWPRQRFLPRPGGTIEVRFGRPVEWSYEKINASGDPSGALAAHIMKSVSDLERLDGTPPMGFWQGYRNVLKKALGAFRFGRTRRDRRRRGGVGNVRCD